MFHIKSANTDTLLAEWCDGDYQRVIEYLRSMYHVTLPTSTVRHHIRRILIRRGYAVDWRGRHGNKKRAQTRELVRQHLVGVKELI